MTEIQKRLDERRIPALPANRQEMLDILSEHIYGFTPDFKSEVSAERITDISAYGGKGRFAEFGGEFRRQNLGISGHCYVGAQTISR